MRSDTAHDHSPPRIPSLTAGHAAEIDFGNPTGSGWWGCGVSLLVITRGTSPSLVSDFLLNIFTRWRLGLSVSF